MPPDVPNKRNRLVKNSIYGLLSWIFPILPTMIATPMVLDSLGKERYGLFVVILGFISYFFTTGIGKVAAKYVAEYRATGETEKISAIISSTILLGMGATLIGTAAVIVFSRPIIADILRIPPELQNDAVMALYLGCATIVSIMLGQVFQLVLQGLHRFDRYLLLTNLSSISFSVGSVIMVLNGFGVIGLLCLNLVSATAIGILSYFMAKKLLPEFKFTVRIGGDTWRTVSRYAASLIAYQIFGSVLLLFERAWIVRQFGVEALTYYAIPMTLAMYLHLFVGAVVLAVFPMANELLTERAKLITLYQKFTKLIFTLVVFTVLSVVVGGRLFLSLWLGDEFAAVASSLLIIHVITFGVLAMNIIAWQIAETFRAAWLNALGTFVWMTVSILLMIGLSDGWQTFGIAVARTAGVLIFIPQIFLIEKYFLGGILWRFWGAISMRIAFAAVLALTAEWLLISGLGRSWMVFAAAILFGAVLYLGGLLITRFFDESERQLFSEMLAKYR